MNDAVDMSFTDLVAKLNEIETRETAERRAKHKVQVENANRNKSKKVRSIKEGLDQALLMQENVLGVTNEEPLGFISPDLFNNKEAKAEVAETDQYSASNSRALMVQLDNMHTKMQKKVEEIYATDNGDLQDQITTMLKVLDNLNSVIARAMKIIPAPQYDSKYNEETDLDEELTFENYALAAAEAAEKGEKEFEYPKGSGKMHPVTISDKAAKKITDDIHAEGYSKHKKGTPKYKRHMAAMHAAKG
jgi:hypothetical protein|tara:strand:+ start:35 stop:775 length:741 start_codon:yes stop_codon:yes gene_type:complete